MLLPNYEELIALKRQASSININSKIKVMSGMEGGHTSLFKGRGLDFSEVREYTSGDDLRSIDWKVTARKGRAHTKIFIEERDRSVYVIVDVNDYMEFGTRQTFKSVQAARAAALIAWQANRLNDRIGAILFGHIPEHIKVLPAKRSRKSIWEMLKLLCAPGVHKAEVKIEQALAVANRRIPAGSTVFIISDFFNMTQEFEKQFGILAKHCEVTLIKVNDPADKSIPHANEIQFSNSKDGIAFVNTNDRNGEELYRRLWIESETTIEKVVRKFRSKIIKLSTDNEILSDLFHGVAPLSRKKGS